jgi:chemotaxis methyl-accepting protein methylase
MRALPRASYVGLEYSDYLCDRYGWTRGSLADFTARQPFDLVVCYDVLQYLDDADAAKALANLARLCRGVLHFSALTKRDWKENADQSRTDPDVTMRSADWYRRRLRRGFREAGAGFWIRRGAPLVVWELETAG